MYRLTDSQKDIIEEGLAEYDYCNQYLFEHEEITDAYEAFQKIRKMDSIGRSERMELLPTNKGRIEREYDFVVNETEWDRFTSGMLVLDKVWRYDNGLLLIRGGRPIDLCEFEVIK